MTTLRRVSVADTAKFAARLTALDAARGIAVIAMAIYHFSWDLAHFGYIGADVESALPWRIFARSIAGSFVLIVGVSLVLATRRGLDWPRFLHRLGIIAAAAASVTVVTYFVFPETYIYFGVLHHIAVASVLGLIFVRAPLPLVFTAAFAAFALPLVHASAAFDQPALIWMGLGTFVPRTNDFVPLFPWFGVALAGIAVARLWPLAAPAALKARLAVLRVPRPLLWTGRHSLAIYLLHQPLLFGLVWLATLLAPPDLTAFEPAYLETCTASCVAQEVDGDICRRTCACAAERTQAEGLWDGMMRQELDQERQNRYFAIVDECRVAAEEMPAATPAP